MKLYVNMRKKSVDVLGPYTRYCLWVSGCNRNCPGCISPESHDMAKGAPYETGPLSWEIIASDTEGITISGGEPFLQARALTELITNIKRHRDIGVIVYTGFLYEELKNVDGADELLSLCDLIIDGPYIKELDDGKALRGSSNQRIIPLTDRYVPCLHFYGSGTREVEVDTTLAPIVHHIGIPTNSTYNEKYKKRRKNNERKQNTYSY